MTNKSYSNLSGWEAPQGNASLPSEPPVRSSKLFGRRVLPPLMPYDQWRALGPEKAAEYLARRRGYSAEQQGKLWASLEFAWNEPPYAPGERLEATK